MRLHLYMHTYQRTHAHRFLVKMSVPDLIIDCSDRLGLTGPAIAAPTAASGGSSAGCLAALHISGVGVEVGGKAGDFAGAFGVPMHMQVLVLSHLISSTCTCISDSPVSPHMHMQALVLSHAQMLGASQILGASIYLSDAYAGASPVSSHTHVHKC